MSFLTNNSIYLYTVNFRVIMLLTILPALFLVLGLIQFVTALFGSVANLSASDSRTRIKSPLGSKSPRISNTIFSQQQVTRFCPQIFPGPRPHLLRFLNLVPKIFSGWFFLNILSHDKWLQADVKIISLPLSPGSQSFCLKPEYGIHWA